MYMYVQARIQVIAQGGGPGQGPGGTVSDSRTTLIFLVTFSSSCCASSLETQCIDALSMYLIYKFPKVYNFDALHFSVSLPIYYVVEVKSLS